MLLIFIFIFFLFLFIQKLFIIYLLYKFINNKNKNKKTKIIYELASDVNRWKKISIDVEIGGTKIIGRGNEGLNIITDSDHRC